MKKTSYITLLFICGLCLLQGCIRVNLEDCPPLKLVIQVQDKNYTNIKDAETLGLMERKDENLPFKEYVQTLSFSVYNEQNKKVYTHPNQQVTSDEQELKIELPASLPYGKYTVVAWGRRMGNVNSEGTSEDVKLEEGASQKEDIYLGFASFDYQYQHEENRVMMKRTKGRLLIILENIPEEINRSTKHIKNIYSSVNSSWNYKLGMNKMVVYDWPKRSNLVTSTLSSPSASKAGSMLGVRFEVKKDNGDIEIAPAGIKQPEDVEISLVRNALTILKYQYNPDQGDFTILVYINDEWQKVHSMEID